MGSPRIAPNRLALVIDGVDYWMDASAVTLNSELSEFDSLEWDPNGPERFLWSFEISGIQSTATGSLWRFLFENVGRLATFRYAVHGNAVPSPSQPHLTGKARVMHPPRLGGEASVRGSQEFDMRLEVSADGRPSGYPVAPTLEEA